MNGHRFRTGSPSPRAERGLGGEVLLGAFAVVLLSLSGCRPAEQATPKLTVFAAASLNEVLNQLSEASVAAGGPGLVINAAGTQALVAQLAAGIAADVFCSANRKYGDQTAARQLTGPARPLARNTLALAATPLNDKVRSVEDLARDDVRVVRCAAAVPAGEYTDQALEVLAGSGQEALAKAIEARIVSLEPDVHGVVAKLSTGAADAGFCYRTDLIAAKLREVPLPETLRLSTECTVAVVTNSAHPDAAAAFVAWLETAAPRRILTAAGFELPGAP